MVTEEIKKEIVSILKDKEISSTEISSLINRNYHDALKILEELESEGIISKIEVGNKYTFWKLKNG